MNASITSSDITEGQRELYKRLVEDTVKKAIAIALKKANPDKDGLQRLLEKGDEFQSPVIDVIVDTTCKMVILNQYANEETRSNYTYPKEYKGPKPITDQIKAIAQIFGLDPAKALENAEKLPQLPEGAEGWFAVPSVNALAKKHFPEVTDPAEKYCAAVRLIHEKIAASRNFYNYREGKIASAHLKIHARTISALEQLESQESEILIIAAQLGMKHRGKSVRRTREVMTADEFGLNSLMVGSIVLVHPERLVRSEELDMDCPGDEFAPGAGGDFSHAPIFNFGDDRVGFGADTVGYYNGGYGSASGFLPQ